MVTHSKIVDPLYILHEDMQFYIFKKLFKHFRKCIFNNVLTSFMDFLFHVPFFCIAAAVVTEILAVCF
jgi:hypothetical protein